MINGNSLSYIANIMSIMRRPERIQSILLLRAGARTPTELIRLVYKDVSQLSRVRMSRDLAPILKLELLQRKRIGHFVTYELTHAGWKFLEFIDLIKERRHETHQ